MLIPHRYIPRKYQRKLFNAIADGYRHAVAVWHRRAGKDKTLWNFVVKEAFKVKAVYYYFFPEYNQGRKVLWDSIDPRTGIKFTDHIPKQAVAKKNDQEMKITLINGSLIQIVGTDNYNSVRGTNPRGCVYSEFSQQDPGAHDTFRPIIAENEGWEIFNYTPFGPNHGQELYEMALNNPQWFCELLTVDDTRRPDGTPVISPERIQEDREAGMSEDMIQQEYFCSFTAAVLGAYFGQEMKSVIKEGRITEIPIDPLSPVFTSWDLGVDDATAIWFWQEVGDRNLFIDYYEGVDAGLDHYADVLKKNNRNTGSPMVFMLPLMILECESGERMPSRGLN